MKLSIITPSLNHGRFIEAAIESVSSQGLPDVEQIVVDGGSDDSTTDRLANAPSTVRWSSTPDRGVAHAVNKGIESSDSDIIGWLNADDCYAPKALAKVMECFEQFPKADVVYGNGGRINEEGDACGRVRVVAWHRRKLWLRRYLCQPAVFFRRKAIERTGLLDESLRYRPDHELWLRLLESGAHFQRIDERLASVRDHAGNRLAGSLDPMVRARAQLEVIEILSRYDHQIAARWLLTYGESISDGMGLSRACRKFDRSVLVHAHDALRQSTCKDFELKVLSVNRRASEAESPESDDKSESVALDLDNVHGFNRASIRVLLGHCRRELKQLLRQPKFLLRFRPRCPSFVRKLFEKKLFRLHNYSPREVEIPPTYLATRCHSVLPKISIATPNRNQGEYIGETIESVLNQGYQNLEYTVQDGDSTDNSIEVIRKYVSQLSSFQSEPDTGQTQAINRGLARTSGEIMAYLNSDDLLLPGSLHYVADFFARHPQVDVIYGHRVLVDEEGLEIGRWVLPPHDDKTIAYADYIPQETMFWRRSAWEAVGECLDESFRFAMDWDLLLRFRRAGMRFYRVPRFLGVFRVTTDQKTSAQMATVGELEMKRLRLRELGRKPNQREINRAVRPYLRRHWLYDKLYTMGVFSY